MGELIIFPRKNQESLDFIRRFNDGRIVRIAFSKFDDRNKFPRRHNDVLPSEAKTWCGRQLHAGSSQCLWRVDISERL